MTDKPVVQARFSQSLLEHLAQAQTAEEVAALMIAEVEAQGYVQVPGTDEWIKPE